jgi:hypothetical protein
MRRPIGPAASNLGPHHPGIAFISPERHACTDHAESQTASSIEQCAHTE